MRPSNQPFNTPLPWVNVNGSPVIIHYGKISEYFTTGQNWKDRAEWDRHEKGSDYTATINHHKMSNDEETLQLEKIDQKWLWE